MQYSSYDAKNTLIGRSTRGVASLVTGARRRHIPEAADTKKWIWFVMRSKFHLQCEVHCQHRHLCVDKFMTAILRTKYIASQVWDQFKAAYYNTIQLMHASDVVELKL